MTADDARAFFDELQARQGELPRGRTVMEIAPWQTKCPRCSMVAHGGLCNRCFDERAKAVYWDREPACHVKGDTKADCLLAVGHEGDHEGNGFDEGGPLRRRWATKPKRKAKS